MHVALLSSCASIHNMHTHFPSPLAELLLVSSEAVLEAVGLPLFSDVEVESGHKDRQGSAIPNDPSKSSEKKHHEGSQAEERARKL